MQRERSHFQHTLIITSLKFPVLPFVHNVPPAEDLQKVFIDSSGVSLLLNAMKLFSKNEILLENCLLIIGALSVSEACRSSVAGQETVQAWIGCLGSDVARGNVMLQTVGCNTVTNLVADGEHRYGGLTYIAQLMSRF